MIELKTLTTDELTCEELRAQSLTVDSINGVTKDEIDYLTGCRGNIQSQINQLNEDLGELGEHFQ